MSDTDKAPRRRRVVTTEEMDLTEPPAPEPARKPPFDEFLQASTPEDWAERNITCLLYRVDPTARARLGQGYLEKLCEPFSVEDVRERFGGNDLPNGVKGYYQCIVSETPPGETRGRIVYGKEETQFYIEGRPKYPQPAAAPAPAPALFGNGDGALLDYIKRQDERIDQLWREREAGRVPVTDPDPAGVLNRSMDILSKTFETALTKLATIAPAAPPKDEITDRLVTVAIERMLAPPPNPLESAVSVIRAIRELGPEFGTSDGPGRGQLALQHGPAIVREVRAAVQDFAQAANANRGLPAAPIPPAATPPGAPASATPPAAPGDAAPAQDWIKAQIVRQIAAGRSGDEIGDWLEQTDTQVVEYLRTLSPEQISAAFAADPLLAPAAAHPLFTQIITEFLEYANGPEAESAAPESAQEAEPAGAPANGKEARDSEATAGPPAPTRLTRPHVPPRAV